MSQVFDVAIVGGGYTGGLLALCLARMGRRVCVLDAGPVPRIALGESTIAETNRTHRWLAQHLDLPELMALSSYHRLLRARVPVATWPKEAFHFVFDPMPALSGPREIFHQTAPWPVGPDMHLWRADLDPWLLARAQARGATLRLGVRVEGVELQSGGVRLRLQDGAAVQASAVVDATGLGGALTSQLTAVRRPSDHLALHSSGVFGHFVGVRTPAESYARGWPDRHIPRMNCTGHHLGPDGWAWVIPFSNGITSVGIMTRTGAGAGAGPSSPQAAFWQGVRDRPLLSQRMAGATAVGPIRGAGAVQQTVDTMVGPRFVVAPAAASSIEPLLSPGMLASSLFVRRVVEADAFRGEDLTESLGRLGARTLAEAVYFSRLVGCLYATLHDPAAFVEAFRVYRLAVLASPWTRPGAELAAHEPAWLGAQHPELRQMVDALWSACQGGAPEAALLRQIWARADPLGFVGRGVDRPTAPGVWHAPGWSQLRWVRANGFSAVESQSPPRALLDAALRSVRSGTAGMGPPGLMRVALRSLRGVLTPGLSPRPGAPASGSSPDPPQGPGLR